VVGFLQRLKMFQGVGPQAVEALAASVELRRQRRGSSLWQAGDPSDAVYWVRSGVISIVQATAHDRVVTIGFFGRGELLGVQAGDGDTRRRDGATIHEDAAVLVMRRDAFQSWLVRYPSVVPVVLEVVATRFARMQERLALVSMHGAKARLAALLLDLSQRFGVRDSRGVIIDLRLTHRELASMIGATRETVSVAMVELRQGGLVCTEHRRIIIVDTPELRARAGI
jgi:CRP/FNR family transcriptional regulator